MHFISCTLEHVLNIYIYEVFLVSKKPRGREKQRLTLCCGFFFLFLLHDFFFWKALFILVNQHHLHHLSLMISTSILMSMSRDSFCLPNFSSTYSSQRHSIIEIIQFVRIAFIVCYMNSDCTLYLHTNCN
jgi:hypothetical protein